MNHSAATSAMMLTPIESLGSTDHGMKDTTAKTIAANGV